MRQIEIKMGQEWYFFAQSITYVIYKIELSEHKYVDGELLESDVVVYLRGSNNTTIIKRPEDFNHHSCKLIKDAEAQVSTDVKLIPVPTKSRLDNVE